MLIKAYIKNHMFHLPMKQIALLEQVEHALNKKVDKSTIAKLNPVTKIEDNENILIEQQHTNIFLLNLLLLVLNHNKKDITEQAYYNNSFIISRLEEETGLNLKLTYEGIEKEVGNYLTPTPDIPQAEINNEDEVEEEEEEKKNSYLDNVEFSLNWLKKAHEQLNKRGE